MSSRITAAVLSSLLIVGGCSDNSSSDDMNPAGDQSDNMNPAVDPSNDTSQPTSGGDSGDLPSTSEPGGDTSAIAGLWDAAIVVEGGLDQRYVFISTDGLYTVYDYRQDAVANDGNCYLEIGPLTLTPEDAATSTYSLPDGRSFTAVAEADTLSIQFADSELEEWNAVTFTLADDLPLCT